MKGDEQDGNRDGEALKICAPPGTSLPVSLPSAALFFSFFFRFRFSPPCPLFSFPLSRTSPYFFTTPISSFLPRNSSGSPPCCKCVLALVFSSSFVSSFFRFMPRNLWLEFATEDDWIWIKFLHEWNSEFILGSAPTSFPHRGWQITSNRGRDSNILILRARVSFEVKIVVIVWITSELFIVS